MTNQPIQPTQEITYLNKLAPKDVPFIQSEMPHMILDSPYMPLLMDVLPKDIALLCHNFIQPLKLKFNNYYNGKIITHHRDKGRWIVSDGKGIIYTDVRGDPMFNEFKKTMMKPVPGQIVIISEGGVQKMPLVSVTNIPWEYRSSAFRFFIRMNIKTCLNEPQDYSFLFFLLNKCKKMSLKGKTKIKGYIHYCGYDLKTIKSELKAKYTIP